MLRAPSRLKGTCRLNTLRTPFEAPGPRWFTIAGHLAFLDALALELRRALEPAGPLALADALVLVPTRRAVRDLSQAFLRTADGPAALLPQIRTLGDLEEGEPPFEPGPLALDLPPAITPLRRRFELAELVVRHEARLGRSLDASGAMAMADALAGFLDGLYLEDRFDPGAVDSLVTDELAAHWRRSADLLAVATRSWPVRLAELGLIDASDRRVRLLRALAAQWETHPPARALIAAGSTGSAPATAELLRVIATAPLGCVVLPGLDLRLDDPAWDCLDDQHPQRTMKRLLQQAGVARQQVRPWPCAPNDAHARGEARTRVIAEALRPADVTHDWLMRIDALKAESDGKHDPIALGLEGLSIIEPLNEVEAAACAALLLRETLETPERTAALITPDMMLARRVAAQLSRWGLEADSSAGTALAALPAGVLAGLVCALAADPRDPVLWLAILKHPLVRLGREPEQLSKARRELERYGLRGPRPAHAAALQTRLGNHEQAWRLAEDLAEIADTLANLFEAADSSAPAAMVALATALERLGAGAAGSLGGLWAGSDGEALAALVASVIEEGESLPPVTALGFCELIAQLLTETTVRTGSAAHPRIRILGALEARMVRADRVILAGLEEGVWPRAAAIDPFLSRSMREALGLPSPERRIGLSAHDFAQAAAADEVVMITCQRRGSQPAVPSRWLWRLKTLARGAGVGIEHGAHALAWARALDAPLDSPPANLAAARRPAPTPPVELRPRELPVSQIETWVRDPYAIYARKILRLRPLDPPDAPVDARLRGTALHKAFERFAAVELALPESDAAVFETLLLEELDAAGMTGAALTRERLLARRLGVWAAAFERRRRQGARVLVETTGKLTFVVGGRDFTLTARPDRLETRENRAHVLDFKSGQPPTAAQMKVGLSPQLTLTAAIIAGGGFEDLGSPSIGELVYVQVTGRAPAGDEQVRAGADEAGAMAQAALDGLKRRVAAFDREDTPYLSRQAMQFIGSRSDYDHLARVYEWAVAAEDSGDGAPT